MESHNFVRNLVIGVLIIAIIVALAIWIFVVPTLNRYDDQNKNVLGVVQQQSEEIAALKGTIQQNQTTDTALTNADTTGKVTEQAYTWHPRFYEETGIGKTKTWRNLVVNRDEYLVVGGTVVNRVEDGVYQGYGPGVYTVTVTDGLVAIVDDDWASLEFNFRVNQAIQFKWAHAHIDRGPIPE